MNILLAILLGGALAAPPAPAEVATLRAELRHAHAENDAAALVQASTQLREAFPGHPSYGYLLARGHALNGDNDSALAVLHDLVARGVDMLDNIEGDAAFETLATTPEYAVLARRAETLHQPIGNAGTAWRFGDPDTIPEAVAVAKDGHVYLGSILKREVLVRNPDGSVVRWTHPSLWAVHGMHLSPDERQLWVATTALKVIPGIQPSMAGRTALAAFDIETGELVAHHELPDPNEHVLGDFLFLDAATVLATDSMSGGVYSLDVRSGEFTPVVSPGILPSPQGLAQIGRLVFIADYSNGLYRFDPADKSLRRIDDGPAAPYGIDGLYAYGHALLGIQNGVRPHQVTRFSLSNDGLGIVARETLLANHPAFDEPTLGAIVDDTFMLVANSHGHRVTPGVDLGEANLEKPVILALPLAPAKRP